jgi:hypothetical protein
MELFSVAEFAAGGAAVAACAGAFDGAPDFVAAVSVDDDVDFVGGGGVLCSHGDLSLSTGGRTFALPISFAVVAGERNQRTGTTGQPFGRTVFVGAQRLLDEKCSEPRP